MKIYNRGTRNQAIVTKSGAVIVPAGKDVDIDKNDFIAPKGRKAKSFKDNHCFFDKADLDAFEGTLKSIDEEAAKTSELSKTAVDAENSAKQILREAEKKSTETDQKLADIEALAEKVKAEKAEAEKLLEEANGKSTAKPTKEAPGTK